MIAGGEVKKAEVGVRPSTADLSFDPSSDEAIENEGVGCSENETSTSVDVAPQREQSATSQHPLFRSPLEDIRALLEKFVLEMPDVADLDRDPVYRQIAEENPERARALRRLAANLTSQRMPRALRAGQHNTKFEAVLGGINFGPPSHNPAELNEYVLRWRQIIAEVDLDDFFSRKEIQHFTTTVHELQMNPTVASQMRRSASIVRATENLDGYATLLPILAPSASAGEPLSFPLNTLRELHLGLLQEAERLTHDLHDVGIDASEKLGDLHDRLSRVMFTSPFGELDPSTLVELADDQRRLLREAAVTLSRYETLFLVSQLRRDESELSELGAEVHVRTHFNRSIGKIFAAGRDGKLNEATTLAQKTRTELDRETFRLSVDLQIRTLSDETGLARQMHEDLRLIGANTITPQDIQLGRRILEKVHRLLEQDKEKKAHALYASYASSSFHSALLQWIGDSETHALAKELTLATAIGVAIVLTAGAASELAPAALKGFVGASRIAKLGLAFSGGIAFDHGERILSKAVLGTPYIRTDDPISELGGSALRMTAMLPFLGTTFLMSSRWAGAIAKVAPRIIGGAVKKGLPFAAEYAAFTAFDQASGYAETVVQARPDFAATAEQVFSDEGMFHRAWFLGGLKVGRRIASPDSGFGRWAHDKINGAHRKRLEAIDGKLGNLLLDWGRTTSEIETRHGQDYKMTDVDPVSVRDLEDILTELSKLQRRRITILESFVPPDKVINTLPDGTKEERETRDAMKEQQRAMREALGRERELLKTVDATRAEARRAIERSRQRDSLADIALRAEPTVIGHIDGHPVVVQAERVPNGSASSRYRVTVQVGGVSFGSAQIEATPSGIPLKVVDGTEMIVAPHEGDAAEAAQSIAPERVSRALHAWVDRTPAMHGDWKQEGTAGNRPSQRGKEPALLPVQNRSLQGRRVPITNGRHNLSLFIGGQMGNLTEGEHDVTIYEKNKVVGYAKLHMATDGSVIIEPMTFAEGQRATDAAGQRIDRTLQAWSKTIPSPNSDSVRVDDLVARALAGARTLLGVLLDDGRRGGRSERGSAEIGPSDWVVRLVDGARRLFAQLTGRSTAPTEGLVDAEAPATSGAWYERPPDFFTADQIAFVRELLETLASSGAPGVQENRGRLLQALESGSPTAILTVLVEADTFPVMNPRYEGNGNIPLTISHREDPRLAGVVDTLIAKARENRDIPDNDLAAQAIRDAALKEKPAAPTPAASGPLAESDMVRAAREEEAGQRRQGASLGLSPEDVKFCLNHVVTIATTPAATLQNLLSHLRRYNGGNDADAEQFGLVRKLLTMIPEAERESFRNGIRDAGIEPSRVLLPVTPARTTPIEEGSPMFVLEFTNDAGQVRTIASSANQETWTLGRNGHRSDIELPSERNISRHQGRIVFEDGVFYLEPNPDTYASTSHNGARIAGRVPLRDSDWLMFGDNSFQFKIIRMPAATPAPAAPPAEAVDMPPATADTIRARIAAFEVRARDPETRRAAENEGMEIADAIAVANAERTIDDGTMQRLGNELKAAYDRARGTPTPPPTPASVTDASPRPVTAAAAQLLRNHVTNPVAQEFLGVQTVGGKPLDQTTNDELPTLLDRAYRSAVAATIKTTADPAERARVNRAVRQLILLSDAATAAGYQLPFMEQPGFEQNRTALGLDDAMSIPTGRRVPGPGLNYGPLNDTPRIHLLATSGEGSGDLLADGWPGLSMTRGDPRTNTRHDRELILEGYTNDESWPTGKPVFLVVREASGWYVQSRGGAGVFVDGQFVNTGSKDLVREGSRIQVGENEWVVRIAPQKASDDPGSARTRGRGGETAADEVVPIAAAALPARLQSFASQFLPAGTSLAEAKKPELVAIVRAFLVDVNDRLEKKDPTARDDAVAVVKFFDALNTSGVIPTQREVLNGDTDLSPAWQNIQVAGRRSEPTSAPAQVFADGSAVSSSGRPRPAATPPAMSAAGAGDPPAAPAAEPTPAAALVRSVLREDSALWAKVQEKFPGAALDKLTADQLLELIIDLAGVATTNAENKNQYARYDAADVMRLITGAEARSILSTVKMRMDGNLWLELMELVDAFRRTPTMHITLRTLDYDALTAQLEALDPGLQARINEYMKLLRREYYTPDARFRASLISMLNQTANDVLGEAWPIQTKPVDYAKVTPATLERARMVERIVRESAEAGYDIRDEGSINADYVTLTLAMTAELRSIVTVALHGHGNILQVFANNVRRQGDGVSLNNFTRQQLIGALAGLIEWAEMRVDPMTHDTHIAREAIPSVRTVLNLLERLAAAGITDAEITHGDKVIEGHLRWLRALMRCAKERHHASWPSIKQAAERLLDGELDVSASTRNAETDLLASVLGKQPAPAVAPAEPAAKVELKIPDLMARLEAVDPELKARQGMDYGSVPTSDTITPKVFPQVLEMVAMRIQQRVSNEATEGYSQPAASWSRVSAEVLDRARTVATIIADVTRVEPQVVLGQPETVAAATILKTAIANRLWGRLLGIDPDFFGPGMWEVCPDRTAAADVNAGKRTATVNEVVVAVRERARTVSLTRELARALRDAFREFEAIGVDVNLPDKNWKNVRRLIDIAADQSAATGGASGAPPMNTPFAKNLNEVFPPGHSLRPALEEAWRTVTGSMTAEDYGRIVGVMMCKLAEVLNSEIDPRTLQDDLEEIVLMTEVARQQNVDPRHEQGVSDAYRTVLLASNALTVAALAEASTLTIPLPPLPTRPTGTPATETPSVLMSRHIEVGSLLEGCMRRQLIDDEQPTTLSPSVFPGRLQAVLGNLVVAARGLAEMNDPDASTHRVALGQLLDLYEDSYRANHDVFGASRAWETYVVACRFLGRTPISGSVPVAGAATAPAANGVTPAIEDPEVAGAERDTAVQHRVRVQRATDGSGLTYVVDRDLLASSDITRPTAFGEIEANITTALAAPGRSGPLHILTIGPGEGNTEFWLKATFGDDVLIDTFTPTPDEIGTQQRSAFNRIYQGNIDLHQLPRGYDRVISIYGTANAWNQPRVFGEILASLNVGGEAVFNSYRDMTGPMQPQFFANEAQRRHLKDTYQVDVQIHDDPRRNAPVTTIKKGGVTPQGKALMTELEKVGSPPSAASVASTGAVIAASGGTGIPLLDRLIDGFVGTREALKSQAESVLGALRKIPKPSDDLQEDITQLEKILTVILEPDREVMKKMDENQWHTFKNKPFLLITLTELLRKEVGEAPGTPAGFPAALTELERLARSLCNDSIHIMRNADKFRADTPLKKIALAEEVRSQTLAVMNASRGLGETTLNLDALQGVEMELPERMIGDILENLISNAMQATAGVTAVTARVEDGRLSIGVVNPGTIAAEVQEKILSGESFTTKEGGSGVGLAVVREYLRRVNGRLYVTGKDGETEIGVSIPLPPSVVREFITTSLADLREFYTHFPGRAFPSIDENPTDTEFAVLLADILSQMTQVMLGEAHIAGGESKEVVWGALYLDKNIFQRPTRYEFANSMNKTITKASGLNISLTADVKDSDTITTIERSLEILAKALAARPDGWEPPPIDPTVK